MNAVLVPERDKAEGHYIAVKNISLRYPPGSPISQELNGKVDRVQFTLKGDANSTDNGVANAINAFNKAMLEAQSPVVVTNMTITYTGVIRGFENNALMSYKIEAVPQMEKFVINGGGNQSSTTGDVVDLEWRRIVVTDPIVLNAPDVGEIEITKPINLIDKTHKDLAKQIFESQASSIFTTSILNFDKFKQPMGTWHFLFDPSGSLVESSSFYKEESGAKVVSIYSLGESSFREGTFEPEEEDATATIGGAQVQVHSQVPAPSGQIQIAGFAKIDQSAGSNIAVVTREAPADVQNATGNFPLQVLLVLGGMMGAIAVFILFKARK
ncbi:hypothetical protein [Nitrososphaera viennensis]|nr:hypothetical protein [Nitrososphaera viennensis]UVS69325.1 hypothetical protein NWT39_00720 [Nitrososphaera viennensis]